MIGVLCQDSETESAREFFELFKTPWQFYRPSRDYEVVISTLHVSPQIRANLIILFFPGETEVDSLSGTSVDPATYDCAVDKRGTRLPLYCKVASFRGQGGPMLFDSTGSEVLGIEVPGAYGRIVRIGYDLFAEVAFLLSEGQPAENALIPTLDLHISLLREWILSAGIALVEIPPFPSAHKFIACLTHDIDFAGIRQHRLDHTMWGFVYRASVGSLMRFAKSGFPLACLLRNWGALLSLPLVYLGLRDDFWGHFDDYAHLEKGLASTFFLIPFKGRAGDKVYGETHMRRAARYDIDDVRDQVQSLANRGCEIGLHGIDAWHSAQKGQQELQRIVEATGQITAGVRVHWLCFDSGSPAALDEAGFDYDATVGYNETIGYRAGTTQVFRPLGATRLLELPLHVQDTALFYPGRLGLADSRAWQLCQTLLGVSARYGGVLTISWHDRSLSPERLWGEFYERLLRIIRASDPWFATAGQVVGWFRARRSVAFEACSISGNTMRLTLSYEGSNCEPGLLLRVYRPSQAGSLGGRADDCYIDIPYTGQPSMEISLE